MNNTKIFIVKNAYLLVLLLILLHLYLLLNVGFTAWPEMMLWPYLILKGWLPYRDIAIAHNPLLVIDLAIFCKLFGVGALQLKIYTWILIIITDLLLFGVAKRLWNVKVATVALAIYIPFQIFYEGNGLWFDLALAPFALLIFYFLKQKNYFLSGILWGLVFLTKQTAIWFLIPMVLTLYTMQGVSIKGRQVVKGALAVFLVFIVGLLLLGIFKDYWFWAVEFGIGILPRAQGQIQFPLPLQLIKALLPYSIFVPLIAIDYKKNWLIAVWAAAGLMGVYPRWELFHFQPSLPFLAIGFALAIIQFDKLKYCFKIFTIVIVMLSLTLTVRSLQRSWGVQTRFLEPEVMEISNNINASYKNDEIFVFNYWDNIYPLTDTVPATRPWVPQLEWYMELPGVQERMVDNLKEKRPPVVVYKEHSQAGLDSFRPEILVDFVNSNYQQEKQVNGVIFLIPR